MLVSLIKGNKIKQLRLPNKVLGNYCITDYEDNNEIKLINIESLNDKWYLISNEYVSVIENGQEKRNTVLNNYTFYLLKNKRNNTFILVYCSPIYDTTYKKYSLLNTHEVTIGKDPNNYIYYKNTGVDENHARIVKKDNKYILVDNDSRLGIYVNNKRIFKKKILENGDVIFIAGLKIILSIKDHVATLIVNNPNDLVNCRLNKVDEDYTSFKTEITDSDDEYQAGNLYTKNDYFKNKYRVNKKIDSIDLNIKEKKDVTFNSNIVFFSELFLGIVNILILVLSLTNNLKHGFIIFIILCIVMIVFYFISKYFFSFKKKNSDIDYDNYIEALNEKILKESNNQKDILLYQSPSISDCQKIILERSSRLWERKKNDNDFLSVNLGTGSVPMKLNVSGCKEHIKGKNITGVPLTISLKDNKKINSIGSVRINRFLIQQILLQIVTLHRYDEVKIVLITSERNKEKWDFVRILPHNFSNDKKTRYFCTNDIEIYNICNYISSQLLSREDNPYYVFIIDNVNNINKYALFNKLLKENNDSVSMIIMSEELNDISNLCDHIIVANDKESTYYENIDNGVNKVFSIDFNVKFNMYECCRRLANIPIKIFNKNLPNNYSFLDMFKVGNIDDLNIYNRWKTSDTSISLKTIIGIDNNGCDIYLDLHKKYHGSHLLIEGMPGSGKTEFLISYILSMSINYNPNDVQFVLMSDNNELNNIFDNKIPHITGHVCYETNELKRFMTSFKSELLNRHYLFDKVSKKINENDVDIYRYQQLYHSNIVNNPLAHLFIIIDEYEKLEEKYPNFINKLLKLSHIGPTYGIHYVFTTDRKNITKDIDIFTSRIQMYNLNSYDKLVNHPGEFYLIDNNNEITLGKCGTSDYVYKNRTRYYTKTDSSVYFIDNIGRIIKKVNRLKNIEKNDISNTQIKNINNYIEELCNKVNISCKKLFLEKISDYNTVANILKKYDITPNKNVFEPVLGEYEDLVNHVHSALKMNLTSSNSIVYGDYNIEYETLISSMLFSSMYLYTPEEINYYIIDYGSGLLQAYSKCPLVGDILTEKNAKKIDNLFKLINIKIEERKKLFGDYTNYFDYINNTNDELPLIVIVINNYDTFMLKEKYIDNVYNLLNNADYGIRFVITSSTLLPYDMYSKFNSIYALKQNNNKLYTQIFNDRINIYPEKKFGRGLTKIGDSICEFQTAYTSAKNKEFYSFVEEQCIECAKEYKAIADNVPELPDKLTIKQVKPEIGKTKDMVIGYDTTLKIIKYNFDDKNVSLISGLNMNTISKFTNPLIKQFAYLNKNDVIVIDATDSGIGSNINNLKYINKDFDKNIELLEEYINNIYSMNIVDVEEKNRTIFINGLNTLYSKLSDDNKKLLDQLILKTKSLKLLNIILVDNYEEIQKYTEYSWYKKMIKNTEGIWVGSGIIVQNIFEIGKKADNNIKDNYCYVIKSGTITLTQYVESFDIIENQG